MHATSEAEAEAVAMLRIIESAYGIEIANKREIINAITEITEDRQTILTVFTALNTWVAMNLGSLLARGRDTVEIPAEVVSKIAEKVVQMP